MRVRAQQLVAHAEVLDETEQRFGGEETLRAELEAKSVFLDCRDYAAGAVTGIEQTHGNSGLRKTIRARQTRDASADYERGKRSWRRSGQEDSIRFSERLRK